MTALDVWLHSHFAPDEPGAAILAVRAGRPVVRAAFGLADLGAGIPLTPEHRFHIGSIGKQWTCLGIMQLRRAGTLAYDDPVGVHLGQLAHWGPGVTVRRLMQHTAGNPDYYDDPALYAQLTAGTATPTNGDALTLLHPLQQLRDAPGARFAYSNTGYELLGTLIETVSGVDYAQFMRQTIFAPLQMHDTFSLPHPRVGLTPPVAHSYVHTDTGWTAYDSDPLDGLLGAGSFYSTLDDMARYDAAVARDALFSPQEMAPAYAPATLNDGTLSHYGFGWRLDARNGQPMWGHTGHWLAFSAAYFRAPHADTSVIVLANQSKHEHATETLALDLLDRVLANA